MDVGNDMSSRIEQVKVSNLGSDVGCNSDSLNACNDISSRIEKVKVEVPVDLGDDNVPSTLHGTALERDGSVAK